MEDVEVIGEEKTEVAVGASIQGDIETMEPSHETTKTPRKAKPKKPRARFDYVFLRRFIFIVFTQLGLFSVLQIAIILIILVCSVVMAYVSYQTSIVASKISAHMTEGRIGDSWTLLLNNIILSALAWGCYLLVGQNNNLGLLGTTLYYLWRRKLTKKLLKLYFKDLNYYVILHLKESVIDNPDQRIQSDTNDFCRNLVSVFVTISMSGSMVVVYTFQLIYNRYYLMLIPIYLLPVINVVVYTFLFSPLAKTIFKKDSKEGDFRFAHARIKEFAESMAFFKSDEAERSNVQKKFKTLISSLTLLAFQFGVLNCWMQTSYFSPSGIYLMVLALMIFTNQYPFYKGQSTIKTTEAASMLFNAAQNCSRAISDMFGVSQYMSVVIGNTARIGEMFEVFREIEKENKKKEKMEKQEFDELFQEEEEEIDDDSAPLLRKNIVPEEEEEEREGEETKRLIAASEEIEVEEKKEEQKKKMKRMKRSRIGYNNDSIIVEGVDVITPKTNKLLLSNVTFKVTEGNSLIIMGPSGCGKSSLARVIAGLWEYDKDKGMILKPSKIGKDGIFFLPQKPMLIQGSLKSNVVYPLSLEDVNCNDEKLQRIMALANIEYLLKRASLHEENVHWEEKLSLGEAQRVAVARLLFHRPKFAILDEASSALDTENENLVYSNILAAGITVISVAHRRSVMKFHKKVITVDGDGKGGYNLEDIIPSMIPEEKFHWKTIEKVEQGSESNNINYEEEKNSENLEKVDTNVGKSGMNITLVKRFFRLCCCGIMMKTPCDWCMVVGNIFIGIFFSLCTVGVIFLAGPILGAVLARELVPSIVLGSVMMFGLIVTGFMIGLMTAIFYFQGIRFRYNITRYIHERYFFGRMFYKINVLDKQIDNPEQRICADVNKATSGFPNVQGMTFVESTVVGILTMFVGVLIGMLVMTGPLVPLSTIVVVVIYASIQIVVMRIISKVQFLQQKREGFFRFSLTRMKEYSEQIAFYGGKNREQKNVEKKFKRVMTNQIKLTLITCTNNAFVAIIGVFSYSFSVFLFILSLEMGIFSLKGKSDADRISTFNNNTNFFTNVMAFVLQLLMAGLWVGQIVGCIGRFMELIERMEELTTDEERIEFEKLQIKKKGGKVDDDDDDDDEKKEIVEDKRTEVDDRLEVANLTVRTPNNKLLFFDLSFKVDIGGEDDGKNNLLIRGPSGVGKSSLTKVIAGLWEYEEGNIYCPLKIGKDGIFFLPQKSYMVLGTFKQQLIYPHEKCEISDDELLEILKEVNIYYLYQRFFVDEHAEYESWDTTVKEWSTILSPGEQQRVALARLRYHLPKIAILDESTSALDEENEDLMYRICIEHNITCVSVGHRTSITKFHHYVLDLNLENSWRFSKRVDPKEEVVEL